MLGVVQQEHHAARGPIWVQYVAAEPVLERRKADLHEVAHAVLFVKDARLALLPPYHVGPRAEPVSGVALWGPHARKPAYAEGLCTVVLAAVLVVDQQVSAARRDGPGRRR